MCKKEMSQINKTPFSEQFQIIDDLFGGNEENKWKGKIKESKRDFFFNFKNFFLNKNCDY